MGFEKKNVYKYNWINEPQSNERFDRFFFLLSSSSLAFRLCCCCYNYYCCY